MHNYLHDSKLFWSTFWTFKHDYEPGCSKTCLMILKD